MPAHTPFIPNLDSLQLNTVCSSFRKYVSDTLAYTGLTDVKAHGLYFLSGRLGTE